MDKMKTKVVEIVVDEKLKAEYEEVKAQYEKVKADEQKRYQMDRYDEFE